jgi:inorganic pyrophosphatase
MAKAQKTNRSLEKLNPLDQSDPEIVLAVIETPMGSRNKFKFDPKLGAFTLAGVLPQGMMFPHAFGFIPSTRADDGDPADILVVMDEPTFAGCVVHTRLIGVIEAEQKERDGQKERNDRIIAVAAHSHDHSDLHTLGDMNDNALKEIEQFFVNYNKERGKEFKVLARKGPKSAWKLVKKSLKKK